MSNYTYKLKSYNMFIHIDIHIYIKCTKYGFRLRVIRCCFTVSLCALAIRAGFYFTMARYNTVCCFDCDLDLETVFLVARLVG